MLGVGRALDRFARRSRKDRQKFRQRVEEAYGKVSSQSGPESEGGGNPTYARQFRYA